MKNLERAIRVYRALYESPVTISSAAAVRNWHSVRDAIQHDGGLLMEMDSLKPVVRDQVLSLVCEFAPLNESNKWPAFVFPDEKQAQFFVNEVTRAGGHTSYLDGGTIVAADLEGMDEVVETAAATFGGAQYRRPSISESFGDVDVTLLEDMMRRGLDPKRVEEAVIDSIYRACDPSAPKPLHESLWIGMDSQEPIAEYAGRLEQFCRPKHVLGVPAHIAEAVRVAGLAPPHLMSILEGSPPGVQPGQQGEDEPDPNDRGGVAKDQPDANKGTTAQSQSGEQQQQPQPTEHVPAQEQGAAGDITLSNGMKVPQEVIAQALGKMLQNLATQVQQGVPQNGVPQKGPGTQPPAVQAAQQQGQSQAQVGAQSDQQAPADQASAQPEGSQPQDAQGAPQGAQEAPGGQEPPQGENGQQGAPEGAQNGQEQQPQGGDQAQQQNGEQGQQPNPEIDNLIQQAEQGDQEALKKAQGMQGQMTDEQKQKLQAILSGQNGGEQNGQPQPQQESLDEAFKKGQDIWVKSKHGNAHVGKYVKPGPTVGFIEMEIIRFSGMNRDSQWPSMRVYAGKPPRDMAILQFRPVTEAEEVKAAIDEAAKMTKKGRAFVSGEIRKMMKKGPSSGSQKGKKMPQRQAVAVALSKADRKGYKGAKKDESQELDEIAPAVAAVGRAVVTGAKAAAKNPAVRKAGKAALAYGAKKAAGAVTKKMGGDQQKKDEGLDENVGNIKHNIIPGITQSLENLKARIQGTIDAKPKLKGKLGTLVWNAIPFAVQSLRNTEARLSGFASGARIDAGINNAIQGDLRSVEKHLGEVEQIVKRARPGVKVLRAMENDIRYVRQDIAKLKRELASVVVEGLDEGPRGKPQHGMSKSRLRKATGKTSSDRDRKGKGRYSRTQAGGGRKGDSSEYGFKKSIRKEPMGESIYAMKHEGRGTSVWEPLPGEGVFPGAVLPEGLDFGSGECEPGTLVMVTESGELTSRIFTAEGHELRVGNEHLSDVGTFHVVEGGQPFETMTLRELVEHAGIQDVVLVVGTPTSGKSHYLRSTIGPALRESEMPGDMTGLVNERCVLEAVDTVRAWSQALNEDEGVTEDVANEAMAEAFGSVAHQLFYDREDEALIQLGETLVIDCASINPRGTPFGEILEAAEGMDVLLVEMRTPLQIAQERNEMRMVEAALSPSDLVRAHSDTRRLVNELWADPRVTHRASYEWLGEDALDGQYVTEGTIEKRQIGKRTTYDIDGEDPEKPKMRKQITVESLLEGYVPGEDPQPLEEQLDVGQAAEGESAAKAMNEAGAELKKAREAIFKLTTANLVQVASMAKASGMKRTASAAEAAMTAASSLLDDLQKVGQLLDKANETMKGENNGMGGDTAAQPANGAAPVNTGPGQDVVVNAGNAAPAADPAPQPTPESVAVAKVLEQGELVEMIQQGAHHRALNEALTVICPELDVTGRANVINRVETMVRVPSQADVSVSMTPRDREALAEAVSFTSPAKPLLERLTYAPKTLATRQELDSAVEALKAHGGTRQLLVARSLEADTPAVST